MTGYGATLHWSAGPAYALSAALFVLAFGFASKEARRATGLFCALLAMAIAIGTTLFVHNATGLPEIGLSLLAGGAVGLILSRFATLVPVLVGLSTVLTVLAICLDPAAFTISGPDPTADWEGRIWLALAAFLGVVSVLGLVTQIGGPAKQAVLGAASGWAAAALGLAVQNLAMAVAGALAGSICATFVARMRAAA